MDNTLGSNVSTVCFIKQKGEMNLSTSSWNVRSINKVVILTVASSEHDAMMSSLNGFHFMSRTGPECPHTFGELMSMRPVYNNTIKINTRESVIGSNSHIDRNKHCFNDKHIPLNKIKIQIYKLYQLSIRLLGIYCSFWEKNIHCDIISLTQVVSTRLSPVTSELGCRRAIDCNRASHGYICYTSANSLPWISTSANTSNYVKISPFDQLALLLVILQSLLSSVFRDRNKETFLHVRRTCDHVRLTCPPIFSHVQKIMHRSTQNYKFRKTGTILNYFKIQQIVGRCCFM